MNNKSTLPAGRQVSGGVVHRVPKDLLKTLTFDSKITSIWEDLTPLARNEWICWVENAKHLETRNRRIGRVRSELKKGIRQPCCWIGCIHKTDKLYERS